MIELKLTGDEEIAKLFAELPKKLQASVALDAIVRATLPAVSAIRSQAPRDTGALKESIGYRVRTYRGGKILFVAIGPRRGQWGPNKEQPSRTAHLIENGHWAGKGKNRRFVAPNAFMRRGWLQVNNVVLSRFKEAFGDGLKVEVQKRASKRRKKST